MCIVCKQHRVEGGFFHGHQKTLRGARLVYKKFHRKGILPLFEVDGDDTNNENTNIFVSQLLPKKAMS